jgi:hypothetical protein
MRSISRISRVAAAFCLMTILWAPHSAPSQQISSAAAGWPAITKCPAFVDEDARHACRQTMTIAATSFGGFMCKFGIDRYVEGVEGAVPK